MPDTAKPVIFGIKPMASSLRDGSADGCGGLSEGSVARGGLPSSSSENRARRGVGIGSIDKG